MYTWLTSRLNVVFRGSDASLSFLANTLQVLLTSAAISYLESSFLTAHGWSKGTKTLGTRVTSTGAVASLLVRSSLDLEWLEPWLGHCVAFLAETLDSNTLPYKFYISPLPVKTQFKKKTRWQMIGSYDLTKALFVPRCYHSSQQFSSRPVICGKVEKNATAITSRPNGKTSWACLCPSVQIGVGEFNARGNPAMD